VSAAGDIRLLRNARLIIPAKNLIDRFCSTAEPLPRVPNSTLPMRKRADR
jgi:hypothetical protein